MGAADSLQWQASSRSQQERSGSSKVHRIMGLETWTAEQEPGADDEEEQPGAEEMALERKKQFEAVCPLLLETGEVLAVPTLEDLTPAMLVYATKSGAVLDPQAVAAGRRMQLQALEEKEAIIQVPHDFPLADAKRIRSKWLDDYSSSGAEVKSRLVATEVAYGNRDYCFAGTPPLKALRLVVSLAASRGRRIAFLDVVAAFMHALIDELVILLLPDGLGQGRTAVLYKVLYGTRKGSRLWQRLLRDVVADADLRASAIFASMYTLGDQRGTLGCWGDDLLIEADEVDLGAVEAHLVKRLEEGTGAALRVGDQKLGGNDTAAFRSALGSVMCVALDRPEILYSTKTVASFMQSPTKSAMVKLKRLVRYLVGFPQAEWAYSKQVVPKYLDVYGDSDWAGDEERKRSTTGVAEIFASHLLDTVSVTQSLVALCSAEAEFYACNRGTAGGLQTCHFLAEAGYKVIPQKWGDSSACRGIVRRTGSGRLRHLEIRHSGHRSGCRKGSSC